MSMKNVRLELGRTPRWPEGNPDCGYEFVAPLDETGHIAVEEWREQGNERAPLSCRRSVRRREACPRRFELAAVALLQTAADCED